MGLRGVSDLVQKRLVELAEGVLVEDDVLGIVEKIQAYDSNLIVQYCDPSQAKFSDAPYKIMELCPDGMRRVIMDVWELDDRVVDRLHTLDMHRNNVLVDLDMANQKATAQGKRRYKEEIDAVSDMVRGVLRSPKDTYTATNPVTDQPHKFRSLFQSDD